MGSETTRDEKGRVVSLSSEDAKALGKLGGRPKGAAVGFAAKIRRRTRNGLAMVELAISILEGNETSTVVDKDGGEHEIPPSVKDRLDAAKWLTERLIGKAVEVVEVTGPDGGPIQAETKHEVKRDPDRLANILALMARAGALPVAGGAGGVGAGADAESAGPVRDARPDGTAGGVPPGGQP